MEAILAARDTGFVPQVRRSSFGVLSRIINPLLTKLARSRWLDIGLVRFLQNKKKLGASGSTGSAGTKFSTTVPGVMVS